MNNKSKTKGQIIQFKMGKGSEEILLKKCFTSDQYAQEKMLNIGTHQENGNPMRYIFTPNRTATIKKSNKFRGGYG